MNKLPASFILSGLLLLAPALKAEELVSPDHRFTIVQTEAEDIGELFPLYRATMRKGKTTLWEYAASCRALTFSWSPDSRHCLFAQWNGDRDISLFLITMDGDDSPRLQEIDMQAVHEAVIAPIPEFYQRPGGYAPVKYIDWDSVRWTTPASCQMVFIDRDTGLDSEAKLQVDLGEVRPKVTILSNIDKIAGGKK